MAVKVASKRKTAAAVSAANMPIRRETGVTTICEEMLADGEGQSAGRLNGPIAYSLTRELQYPQAQHSGFSRLVTPSMSF